MLKKIGLFRSITLGLFGFFTTIIVLGAALVVYYAAISNGNNSSVYIIAIGLIIIISMGIFSINFFKSYTAVVSVMTAEDLANLEKVAQSRSWLEQYLPSFIIYSGKIRVFKLYSQPDFYFTELREISIRPHYFSRGTQNKLVIFKNLEGKTYFFGMNSNPIQRQHLFDKALEYNPNILINNNV